MTNEVKNYYEEEPWFQYKRISVSDSQDEQLDNYFDEAAQFIQQALKERELSSVQTAEIDSWINLRYKMITTCH